MPTTKNQMRTQIYLIERDQAYQVNQENQRPIDAGESHDMVESLDNSGDGS